MSNAVRRRALMIRYIAATAIMAVATAASAPDTPAHAGGPYSWRLCVGNQPTTQTALRYALPGPPLWPYYGSPYPPRVGYPVQPGDVLRIRARGSMKIDSWPWGPSVSPDGDPGTLHPTWTGNANLPLFGLYGTFLSTYQDFRIGTDSGCVVYRGTEPTTLMLNQNDPKTGDNSGTWDIDVKHYHS